MATMAEELAKECRREEESCLYTSTSLFLWLRLLRLAKFFFTVTPLLLGALASWKILTASEASGVKFTVAIFSFLAGLLPSIYSALKYDEYLAHCQHLAGEFKNLQDRFRKAALVSSQKEFKEFEDEYNVLVDRLERARSHSITAPECFFNWARKKIEKGDYDFGADRHQPAKEAASSRPKS